MLKFMNLKYILLILPLCLLGFWVANYAITPRFKHSMPEYGGRGIIRTYLDHDFKKARRLASIAPDEPNSMLVKALIDIYSVGIS